MKNILLCTIPKTGTHFFKKLFEDHGFNVKAVHLTDDGLDMAFKACERNDIVVTTYRNLSAIEYSWLKNLRDDNLDKYIENWYRLQELEPVIVSVDSIKEARLNLASAILGVELKTDWKAVNETKS